MTTKDEFVHDLLDPQIGPEIGTDYSNRLKEMFAHWLPQIDNTVYTCSNCGLGYRGPICGHCGAQHMGIGE